MIGDIPGLPCLSLGSFTKELLTPDALHFEDGFTKLYNYLESKPYLQGGSLSMPGCLAFVIGLTMGFANCYIGQFPDEDGSPWSESPLSLQVLSTLQGPCDEFHSALKTHVSGLKTSGRSQSTESGDHGVPARTDDSNSVQLPQLVFFFLSPSAISHVQIASKIDPRAS